MVTSIIPHTLSLPRFLQRPQRLTRLTRLPVGRPILPMRGMILMAPPWSGSERLGVRCTGVSRGWGRTANGG